MIGRTDQVYNKEKRRYEYHRTRTQKTDQYRFTKYVIVVRRLINSEGFPRGIEVDIRGPRLQKALLNLNKDTEGFGFQKDPPEVDPRILYHSLGGLEKLLEEAERASPVDEEMIFELRAGIQFVHEHFEDTFSSLKTLLPTYQINFENLWTLYPPNTVVWTIDEFKHLRAYNVKSAKEVTDKNGMPWLILNVKYVDSNGEDVGWVENETLQTPWFPDVRSLWSLRYIPLNLGPDPESTRSRLIANGRAAIARHGRQLVEYKGPGLRRIRDQWVKFNSHGRVMLDPETWVRTHPEDNPVPSISSISLKSLKEDEDKLMLVSSIVFGYSMGDQIWGKFAVTDTADPEWNDDAFQELVLKKDVKNFIHDLVSEHRVAGSKFDDIIRDKGRGLVGLLAGPPGVGKTLTAEAIAEISRRPLYVISSGQLGHEPTDIHDELKGIFELAEHWDAVVLLDEADIFMATRGDLDLARNAIVSVFLRELEYFQGIILLTTNRATAIDPAFQSRIHFTMHYPDLDEKGRRAIWRSFLAIAARDDRLRVDINFDKGEDGKDNDAGTGVAALARSHNLNGRQIKNAVSVAQAVALKRSEPLTVDKVEAALNLSQYTL
ncbi:P-loop containing nucleoside triphosphate hydrolase protein [Hypoxylon sp. FL1284]|nr:P-loop containing nucleoside triphosphate hydrolase protein [Hypoxylon sp. FL1284]